MLTGAEKQMYLQYSITIRLPRIIPENNKLFPPSITILYTGVSINPALNMEMFGIAIYLFIRTGRGYSPQSKEANRGPPELVQHFRL